MKRALILALLCTSTASLTVLAQTYQWKDSQGRTIISDTPPPPSIRQSRTVATPEPAAPASSGKTLSERDMEFRKRQQEGKERSEKENKEAAAAAERKENCERARRQLTVLESGQRMSTIDANGERRFIEDAERQQEIERARRYVAETCK